MDKSQKKSLLIGGGVIAVVGGYALTQRGKDTPFGTMGDVIAAPMDSFVGTEDTGVPAGETVGKIMEMLPELPPIGGDSFGQPSGFSEQPPDVSGMTTAPKKSRFPSFPSFPGFPSIPQSIITAPKKVIMSPVAGMQVLGGASAIASQRLITGHMTPEGLRRYKGAQATRVKKYPRASHAVSMVTGGVTSRAPVTKKQVAARKKYPRTYKVFKSAFGWLGA